MDRHELLTKKLQAKYELEICEERDKARHLANLNAWLDQAIGQRNLSRFELLEALRDRMAEYRAMRKKQEMPWGAI